MSDKKRRCTNNEENCRIGLRLISIKQENDVWDQASKIQDRNRNDADEMAMESAKDDINN